MEKIALADTGRKTTRLGFGGSSLMAATGRKASLALLEEAYDAGIRHFDVAPMYGFGAAEGCLGEFLARHPGELTVTTKYGIAPARNQPLLGIARSIAVPVIKLLPSAKRRLSALASTVARPAAEVSFTAAEAQLSLDRSLKELHTSRVDVWLLHEVTSSQLADDGLLRFLEESVAAGKIGTFGVGSGHAHIADLLAHARPYCRVLQYEWSILNPVQPDQGSFRIHHRALTRQFGDLHLRLTANRERCRHWSDQTGVELSQREMFASLMLKAALVLNPASVILFSSKNAAHIHHNVAVAQDDSLAEPARRLHTLLQTEGLPASA